MENSQKNGNGNLEVFVLKKGIHKISYENNELKSDDMFVISDIISINEIYSENDENDYSYCEDNECSDVENKINKWRNNKI